MPYSTQKDLELAVGGYDRLVELVDWDGDGTADRAVIETAIKNADALIDSYLRRRYQCPIANPSDTLRRLSAEEAIYWIRTARGMRSEDTQETHEERVRWLEQASRGEVAPNLPEQTTASKSVKSAWVTRDLDDVSREGLKGFS